MVFLFALRRDLPSLAAVHLGRTAERIDPRSELLVAAGLIFLPFATLISSAVLPGRG